MVADAEAASDQCTAGPRGEDSSEMELSRNYRSQASPRDIKLHVPRQGHQPIVPTHSWYP